MADNIQSSSNSDISFSYDLYKIIDDESLLNNFSIDLNSEVNAETINVIYQNVSLLLQFLFEILIFLSIKPRVHNIQNPNFFKEYEFVISLMKKYADNYVNYCEPVECKFLLLFVFCHDSNKFFVFLHYSINKSFKTI
jgi:hypothetical protein